MVQETRGEIQSNLADRLRSLIRRPRIVEVPLDFTLSADEQGRHVIETYMTLGGERKKVANVQDLWKYGYSFEKNNVRYVLDKQSLNILLAIRSMNPQVIEDDKIISDVYPTVLNYLRKRGNISEDGASRDIKVQEIPLKHSAEISYDPNTGLHVKTGYEFPDQKSVIRISDFKKSPDGEYVMFGDGFYRLPKEENSRVREWIDTQEKFINLEEVPEFFKRDLVLLKTNFNAVLTDQAEKIKVVEGDFKPRFLVTMDEKGWLDFNVDYEVGEYKLSHDAVRKLKSDYIHPDENTWIKVDRDSIRKADKEIESLDAIKTDSGYGIPITRFVSLEDAIEHIGGDRQVSAQYQSFLDELTDFKPDPAFRLHPEDEACLVSNGIDLRSYQRSGIHWLYWLANHHLHGILADDMGLGKTVQTIATIRLMYESTGNTSHSLIICPKSVVGHWYREIKRVYPSIDVYEYMGQERDAALLKNENPIIFITTYETMARDIDILDEVPFFYVVLDEGTKIKNPATRRAMATKTLNAVHRVALSGTPIENRPLELWSIFDFLMKGHLGSYDGFVSRYEKPIQDNDATAAKMLAKRIKPFILRRMKENVAKDLPEKLEMSYWCGMTEEQKSLYGQIQEMYIAPVREKLQSGETVNITSVLPAITKLKQVCDHPALINGVMTPVLERSEKFDLIAEIIDDILTNDEAAVIFSHFLGVLDLFESYLKEKNVSYIRIEGSTENRQELIDKFNTGVTFIALCSLMAAGHGINLTAASHVIHVDRWWNPAVEDQATDRVHRMGQTKKVYVHKVLTEGTLEERIDTILETKRGVSDIVIGAATKGVQGWTREELLEILKPI